MLRSALLTLSFVFSICLVAFVPVAEAQRVGKVYRVGVLGIATPVHLGEEMGVFRQALREHGWVNERAITFEERYAGGHYERLPQLAAELVALKVDVIFAAGGTPAAEAAIKATREIPIVFSNVGDPVAQKMVQSLAHPGGNVTGSSLMSAELAIRSLALLKEAVPGIKRVGYFLDSANPAEAYLAPIARAAGQSVGVQLETFDIRDSEDIEKAFQKMSRAGVQALDAGYEYQVNLHLRQIGELALKHRLPMMACCDEAGVLLASSPDTSAMFRRAAAYVDKILRGANPGDLPIEQPTKFHLIINLRTARALGITIPQGLLLRADEVIQ